MSENIQQSARAPGLNGANCLTAPNSKRRRIPKGAESRRAQQRNRETAQLPDGARRGQPSLRALRDSRASWDFAPSGFSRRLYFGASWDFAPFMPCAVDALRR
jgi:hypothetical protein